MPRILTPSRGFLITPASSKASTVTTASLSNLSNAVTLIPVSYTHLLIIVAVIPILASGLTGANVGFGGTSIIIIVGVILETLQTIKSMITERSYSTVKGIF